MVLSLRVRNKSFHGQDLFRDLNLNLKSGERVSILGSSGIGKTTLLRIITGLDHDFDGDRRVPDRTVLMFQNPALLPWRTALANLTIFHPQIDAQTLRQAMTKIGLGDKADAYPNQLSLGQQRRLALLRTMVSGAELVLLDEPFASLDDQTRAEVIGLVQNWLGDAALILVTHSIAEAQALTNRILALEDGALIETAPNAPHRHQV